MYKDMSIANNIGVNLTTEGVLSGLSTSQLITNESVGSGIDKDGMGHDIVKRQWCLLCAGLVVCVHCTRKPDSRRQQAIVTAPTALSDTGAGRHAAENKARNLEMHGKMERIG